MKLDQEEFSNDAHTDKHAKVTVLAPNVVRQLSVVDWELPGLVTKLCVPLGPIIFTLNAV
jgi:hypothetical protein